MHIFNVNAWNFNSAGAKIHTRFQELNREQNRVHTGTWQGVDISKTPAGQMLEIMNAVIHIPDVRYSKARLASELSPLLNLPWVDDHFEERVCGYPINPGLEWQNWPDGQSASRFLDENGQFNHNYMERYWPKYAGLLKSATGDSWDYEACTEELRSHPEWRPLSGIRHAYGDLSDLLDLLEGDPLTRQAYLPIFFPEDTGVGDGGRKPCTLGYQFMLRGNALHIYYPMRSCDFYRHWADDVYMTVRLADWVIQQLSLRRPDPWASVKVGSYTMHCTSLHAFLNDFYQAERDHGV